MTLHGHSVTFVRSPARHEADNWNKLKNLASKTIGEKMKVSRDAISFICSISDEMSRNAPSFGKGLVSLLLS